jgi:hypothetical protein
VGLILLDLGKRLLVVDLGEHKQPELMGVRAAEVVAGQGSHMQEVQVLLGKVMLAELELVVMMELEEVEVVPVQ